MRVHVPRILGVCGLLLALAVGPLTTPRVATASGPLLALSPTSATPGSTFTISGFGFRPYETVNLYWNGSKVTGLPVSAYGTFAVHASIAATAAAGPRSIVARGSSGDRASATFTVLPPMPQGIPTSGMTSNGCQITPAQAAAEWYLFRLLDQHRAAAGARPLVLNETLSLAARAHSCDMFEHQVLSHTGSDGSSPFQRIAAVGITFTTAGENIGMTAGLPLDSGVFTIDGEMMAEPLTYGDHHWNIVNPAYTQVGIGIIYAASQVWLTEDFVG